MTLEHIPATLAFLRDVRAAQGDRPADIFFMIPEAQRILRDCAFEDVYYEHCSYFSPHSLEHLFRAAGFFPTAIGFEYADQYLTIAAHTHAGAGPLTTPADLDELAAWVRDFPGRFAGQLAYWRGRFADLKARGQTAVIWGSGSKGVSFLTTLGLTDEVAAAVDINPHRQGYFMPGTGHRIVGPADLAQLKPDAVIVMNPIYRDEIAADLAKLGLEPRLLMVDDGLHEGGGR